MGTEQDKGPLFSETGAAVATGASKSAKTAAMKSIETTAIAGLDKDFAWPFRSTSPAGGATGIRIFIPHLEPLPANPMSSVPRVATEDNPSERRCAIFPGRVERNHPTDGETFPDYFT
ncbi:MAG: hypothetical protein ACRDSR_20940 [Pseudonocardiaceae bacterium]